MSALSWLSRNRYNYISKKPVPHSSCPWGSSQASVLCSSVCAEEMRVDVFRMASRARSHSSSPRERQAAPEFPYRADEAQEGQFSFMTPGPGAGRSAEFLSLDLISIVTSHRKATWPVSGEPRTAPEWRGQGPCFLTCLPVPLASLRRFLLPDVGNLSPRSSLSPEAHFLKNGERLRVSRRSSHLPEFSWWALEMVILEPIEIMPF